MIEFLEPWISPLTTVIAWATASIGLAKWWDGCRSRRQRLSDEIEDEVTSFKVNIYRGHKREEERRNAHIDPKPAHGPLYGVLPENDAEITAEWLCGFYEGGVPDRIKSELSGVYQIARDVARREDERESLRRIQFLVGVLLAVLVLTGIFVALELFT